VELDPFAVADHGLLGEEGCYTLKGRGVSISVYVPPELVVNFERVLSECARVRVDESSMCFNSPQAVRRVDCLAAGSSSDAARTAATAPAPRRALPATQSAASPRATTSVTEEAIAAAMARARKVKPQLKLPDNVRRAAIKAALGVEGDENRQRAAQKAALVVRPQLSKDGLPIRRLLVAAGLVTG
jgi:hypothetical protein